MKKHIKKVFCIVLALVLTMSLSACSADPNCGNYVCKTVQVDDMTGPVSNVFAGGASIELKQAGACDFILDGVKYEGSWKSDGSKVTLKIEEEQIDGTVSGNTLSIEKPFDVGMTMNFEK